MKKLFNFYLEDNIKELATKKLENCMGKTEKGALASLIRVMLNNFIATEEVNKTLIQQVIDEYVYTQTKNKRSTM